MNIPTRETSIEEILHDVHARTEAMEFAEALAILEIALAADAGNIYLSALKRQLETMFSLQRGGELSAEKKIELMESVPGIVECAVREHRRHSRPVSAGAHRTENGAPSISDQQAGRELEALKLLYFQRASKFLMNGEYEQALAEVERVFIVDPSNSIAKQYSQRVEQLIQQARKLAAAPEGPSLDQVAATADEGNPPSSDTSTAWTDEFLAQPTGGKHAAAYGTSPADSLTTRVDAPDAAPLPVRRRSSHWLAIAAIVLLMGGSTIALLIASSTDNGVDALASTTQSAQVDLDAQTAGTLVAPQTANDPPARQEPAPSTQQQNEVVSDLPTSAPPVSPASAAVKEPPPRGKPEPDPVNIKKSEPLADVTPKQPVIVPLQESAPAVIEPAPAETPAFVAIEKQPEIITLEKPQFAPFVWKTGVEAQVVIRVLIDTDGNPVDAQVLKSTNSIFEGPVIDAVMKSKFAPAQMGQGPVSAWLTIPFKMKQPK